MPTGSSLAAPVAAAVAIAAAYFVLNPHPVDLAAHVYRADLFAREGFTLWNGGWYAGEPSLSYSVLYPPLGWLLSPVVVGTLAAIATAAAFAALTQGFWGTRARWGALWLGLGSGTLLFTGRVPFALGLAFATLALLALQRRHPWIAAALACLCALSSPVAGAFLALCAAVIFLRGQRRDGFVLATAALAPTVVIAAAFSQEGAEPFALSSVVPALLLTVAFTAALPRKERALRIGGALYGVAILAAWLIPTPMGGNVVRLGMLFAGPLLACAVAGRMPRGLWRAGAVVLVLAALAFWQWRPAVHDYVAVADDPSTSAAFYQPLLRELGRFGGPPGRIEIPFTKSHWEATEVALRYPLARGWMRQIDIARNPIFYDNRLTAASYGRWLSDHAVRFVALPSATPDYSSLRERALIEGGLRYLRLVWRSPDWRLYEVTLPHSLVVPDHGAKMQVISMGNDEVVLDVIRAGSAVVKVEWSPYWRAVGGCVAKARRWTRLVARQPGPVRLSMSFTPDRLFDRGPRCD
jgi:hypothetical protein